MKQLGKFVSIKRLAILGLLIIVAITPAVINTGYIYRMLFFFSIYTVLAEAYNLIAGFTGQYSFGNGVFFGIGAYAVAVSMSSGLVGYAAIPIGVIVGIAVSVLLSVAHLPLFRLRGIFFAMGTLFVNEVLKIVVSLWKEIGGGSGIVIQSRGTYNLPLASYLAYFFSIVVVLLVYWISREKMGYGFKAVREDEDLAESIGIHPSRYKALAFAINALIVGIAGGAYAYVQSFIEPASVFDLNWSLLPAYMMIIGGKGTVVGPILGAIFYASLSEVVSGLRALQLLFFGAIVILVVLFAPRGLHGLLETLVKLIKGEKKLG